MTKKTATVGLYMTAAPHSIGKDQTLSVAHELMREHKIRHLPVLSGGKLVGMLTHRDLALIESFPDVDPKEVTVEDAMSGEVYTVPPDAPLAEVAAEMAERKYGSAVVMEKRKIAGIFTTVDACRALAETLGHR